MLHLVKTAVQVVQIPYYLDARGMREILHSQTVHIFYYLYECLTFHSNYAKRLTSEILHSAVSHHSSASLYNF